MTNLFRHSFLVFGILIIMFPIYFAFTASTHTHTALMQAPLPLLPGGQALENYGQLLLQDVKGMTISVTRMMLNSFIMAFGIALGKTTISILSAFAIVFFRFPFRNVAFFLIFLTLMLPIEVRIVPTFQVVSNLNLYNTYGGMVIPLLTSATATFLFRQFFSTIPKELVEAAKMDGATPLKFFFNILLPLSRTHIAALFVILFIYGWNQYLWPLLVVNQDSLYTIVISIKRMIGIDGVTYWNMVMSMTCLAMLPPLLVIILMQRLFIKGLIETEK